MFDAEVQKNALNIFFDHVSEKETAYKQEIAKLEAKVLELEKELENSKDPMRATFVKAGTRLLAMSMVPWGVTTAKVEGGYWVFASYEAHILWHTNNIIEDNPGILDEKPENRKLLKVNSRYMAKKLAPWAWMIAKVKSGFIAFPSCESYLHWRIISDSDETAAAVAG